MVYVGNLVDALCCMVESQHRVEGVFHITDAGDAMTTRETFLELGKLMGKGILEVPVPVPMVRMLGHLVGMGEEVDRLTRSLTTQGVRLADELGWHEPYSMQEGLSATAQWFTEQEACTSRR